MKTIHILILSFLITLAGCNQQAMMHKIVPDKVDDFAKEFIELLHKGEIDSCMNLVSPEMQNSEGRYYLSTALLEIETAKLDSGRMVSAQSKKVIAEKDEIINYLITYEYPEGGRYVYFKFAIKDENGNLTLVGLDGGNMKESLSKKFEFSLQEKSPVQYLFLILGVVFTLFMLITAIRVLFSSVQRKWMWIIGVLIGIGKFSVNWTSGQVTYYLLSSTILGIGIVQPGPIEPWIVSFSIPVVAVVFWVDRYREKNAAKRKPLHDESNRITDDFDQEPG